MTISLSLHIVGIVMWLGGLMILTRFLQALTSGPSQGTELLKLIRRSFLGFVGIGCALTLLTGLYQLFFRGMSFYMRQGWFHSKLTLVVILLGITFLVFLELQKADSGGVVSSKKMHALHGLIGLILLAAVFLTMFGRGL